MAAMNWSAETYRLDEVELRFPLPCVILVNEGYYSETDAEGFSAGDILSIDKKVVLHKVAANFAYEKVTKAAGERDYVDLVEREILVPLNYRGKLKVLRHVKNYDSVSELAQDFPRYAKLRQNLKVRTEDSRTIEIQAGTIIELDRVIPGNTYGPRIEPDKLVVSFRHVNKDVVVAIPFTDKAKFRTEPDENKYTIKEAIDRYSLPQHVKFIDDEIKRVYTQDLMEGLANMRTITETLRLNRLLTQNVLVGHYKPVEEASPESGDYRKRTLIVLPLDNPEIREIEVNILQGATEEDYETIFRVRNVSNTDELVDGSLYIDFAASTPGIKRISHSTGGDADAGEFDTPPPVPPKPASVRLDPLSEYEETQDLAVKQPVQPPVQPPVIPDDDYIEPEPVYPPRAKAPAVGFSLAEMNFNISGQKKPLKQKKKKDKHSLLMGKKQKDKAGQQPKSPQNRPLYKEPMPLPPEACVADGVADEMLDADLVVYDTVNENEMLESKGQVLEYRDHYKQLPSPRPVRQDPPANKKKAPGEKQVARVKPETRESETRKKLFKDLNCDELVERLKYCGLHEFARTCEVENLNGAFFENITVETLKDAMDLKGIQLAKFVQMRDENWMPS